MTMLRGIEKFLRRTDMPVTRFGRLALGDPRLVTDMRNGRELRARTEARVRAFIAQQDSVR